MTLDPYSIPGWDWGQEEEGQEQHQEEVEEESPTINEVSKWSIVARRARSSRDMRPTKKNKIFEAMPKNKIFEVPKI